MKEIEEAIEVVGELHGNCRSDGFQYEVNHGNMSQEEADKEITIQDRYKKNLQTALSALKTMEWIINGFCIELHPEDTVIIKHKFLAYQKESV